MLHNKLKLTRKSKLLIYEYKERYPSISAYQVSDMFNLDLNTVIKFYKKGEIIIPSKMNSK
jgi:hypothetical protein